MDIIMIFKFLKQISNKLYSLINKKNNITFPEIFMLITLLKIENLKNLHKYETYKYQINKD